MDTQTATIVLVIIIAVALATWLISVQYRRLATINQEEQEPLSPDSFHFPDDTSKRDWLIGQVDLKGSQDQLLDAAAAQIARESMGAFGPVKIQQKSKDLLEFEAVVPTTTQHRQYTPKIPRGVLRFRALNSDQTRVEYALDVTALRKFLKIAAIVQFIALVFIVFGGWAMYRYVVQSPHPTIRWQTFQMLQIIHFLWPPFLFTYLYRRVRREAKARLEAFVNNLPYYDPTT